MRQKGGASAEKEKSMDSREKKQYNFLNKTPEDGR